MLKIYDVSLSVISRLKPVIGAIERRDSDLARQLRRALASVALNIAEGSYARGRNRNALYQVALGSAKESKACLDVADGYSVTIEISKSTVLSELSVRVRSAVPLSGYVCFRR